MADEQNTDDPLRRALDEFKAGRADQEAVGRALLESDVIALGGVNEGGEVVPSLLRRADGSLDAVTFTDQERAEAWPLAEHLVTVNGRELVLLVEGQVDRLLIDPGAGHSGYLTKQGVRDLATLARSTTKAPMERPVGGWATARVSEAVRGAVTAHDGILGAWLVEREGFPTVALHLAPEADEDEAIRATAEAIRPLAAGGARIAILLLSPEQLQRAEELGPPLQ